MVQVIRNPPVGSLIGEGLQKGLATGLQSGLQQLLSQKLQGVQRRETGRGLEALGFSPEVAESLSGLDKSLLSQVIKSQVEAPKLAQQQQFLQQQGLPGEITSFSPQAQKAFIQQLLPEAKATQLESLLGEVTPQPEGLPQQQEQISELLQQQQGTDLPQDQQREFSPSTPQEEIMVQEKEKTFTTEPNESFSQTKKEIKDFTNAQPLDYELSPGAKAFRETRAIDEKLKNSNLTNAQRALLKKQKESTLDKAEKKQSIINKRVDPFRRKVSDVAKGAEENNQILNKMRTLIDNDGVAGPLTGNVLDLLKEGITIGGFPLSPNIDLFGFTTSGTQEFKKLSTGLIRNIRDIFGARISNQELRTFMDTIPTLNQSDEGKRRVINSMRILNKGLIARKKALDEILSENGGYAPHNLETLSETRAKPELDAISKEFNEIFVSPQQLAKEQKLRQRGLLGLPLGVAEDIIGAFRT